MGRERQPTEPRERHHTLRQEILMHLSQGSLSARDLSGLLGIPEKEVLPHLEHLRHSLRRSSVSLVIEPAQCLGCGYEFTKRTRLSRPSACPRCRAQHIEAPRFRLEDTVRNS
jgi:predicted Zn-ribbon and HTH transcriptional regulator